MRSTVSRRSLLLSGTGGLSLVALSACGLRLDTEPDVPTLDSAQELRNRIARILAATEPGAGDPETAGEDLQKFRDAIGPEWSPPVGYSTQAPAPEEDRTFIEAAEEVGRSVFAAGSQLGSGLIPVLVDVATGLTLIAGEKDSRLIADADELIRAGREETSGAQSPGASEDSSDEGHSEGQDEDASEEKVKVWSAILNQSRAAAYGYERLAVSFDAKSPERKGALARLESLGSLSGEMLEKLGEKNADPGASAWKLDPSPTDADSARQLALSLEDGLVTAVLGWLDTDTSAILRLWESARARCIFAEPQPLRFAYSGVSGEAEAEK